MEKSGLIEFAPHTSSHKKLSLLSEEGWRNEIDRSHELLPAAKVFSYPYGDFTKDIVSYVRKKFSGAVTVKEGLVDQKTDLHLLPRNSIDSSTNMIQFRAKVARVIAVYNRLKV